MDVHAVVGLDAVDGLDLGAPALAQLPVGTTIEDSTLEQRTLERAASDGDYLSASMRCLTYAVGLAQRYLQLHDKLGLRTGNGLTLILLCPDCQGQAQHTHEKRNPSHGYFISLFFSMVQSLRCRMPGVLPSNIFAACLSPFSCHWSQASATMLNSPP